MKKIFVLILLLPFTFYLLPCHAQTDTTKNKKAKPYKQGPSYIDANLYKLPPLRDTTGDTILKKKLNLKFIDKDSFGPVTADYPPDAILAQKNTDGSYFEKPHSVAWFEFTAPQDTDLTIDIEPLQKDDDIDFLLFKDETGDFGKVLASGGAKPVRSNIAKCDKRLYGKTGLSKIGLHDHEPPGKHSPYSKPLRVKKGEHFFLAVDNFTSEKRPFTLFVHLRWPAFQKPPPPAKPPQMQPLANVKVNIIVLDSAGHPVRAKLKIAGVVPHKLIDTNNVTKYTLTLQPRQKIKVTGIAEGYLLSQHYFTAPDNTKEINDTVILSPIKKNGNMVLQDIEFEPDQAVILLSSYESLNNLLEFMKSNPTVHILIKGYVNDPQKINTSGYDQDLSERRAKAVLKYLNEHGIDENRMEWQGFGSRDMLYPNPQTLEEMQANRRVEIEVK